MFLQFHFCFCLHCESELLHFKKKGNKQYRMYFQEEFPHQRFSNFVFNNTC